MRWQARLGDQARRLEMTRRSDGLLEATVDGRAYLLNVTQPQASVYSILADGASHEAIVRVQRGSARVRIGGTVFDVAPDRPELSRRGPGADPAARGGQVTVSAVMPGRVLRVMVKPGDKVASRQGLVVIEAMKMENELSSPREGTIKEVRAEPGRTVETGETLVVIEP
jgi:biotin carboxyl carrier protein